jgi:hypothetical protein
MFPAKIVQRLGGYRSPFTRSMDWDLCLRLAEVGPIACVRTQAVRVRRRSESLSNTEGGRLQIVMGLAATTCHFLRAMGSEDPSTLSREDWAQFLGWLDEHLLRSGFYATMALRSELINTWSARGSVFRRAWSVCRDLSWRPALSYAHQQVLGGTTLPRRLAQEYARARPRAVHHRSQSSS